MSGVSGLFYMNAISVTVHVFVPNIFVKGLSVRYACVPNKYSIVLTKLWNFIGHFQFYILRILIKKSFLNLIKSIMKQLWQPLCWNIFQQQIYILQFWNLKNVFACVLSIDNYVYK